MSSAAPIVVWIVEDDADYRKTLTLVLDHDAGAHCGAAFDDCETALACLDSRSAPEPLPDVLLLDVNLPGRSGLDALGDLRQRLPDTHVVMLTIRDEADVIYAALRAGASGYLLKNAGIDQVVAAVREAHGGGMLMPAPVARKVLAFFQEDPSADYRLTEREREVLREMTAGHSQKEIAARLFVSPHTVNTHVQHVYEKLHVRSGIEAVAKALRERLV